MIFDLDKTVNDLGDVVVKMQHAIYDALEGEDIPCEERMRPLAILATMAHMAGLQAAHLSGDKYDLETHLAIVEMLAKSGANSLIEKYGFNQEIEIDQRVVN